MLLEMSGIPAMAGGKQVAVEQFTKQIASAIARYKKLYGKEPPAEDVQALKDHIQSLSKPTGGLRTGISAAPRARYELATDPNLINPNVPDQFLSQAMLGRGVKGTYLRPKVQDINDPNVVKNIEKAQEAGTLESIPQEMQSSITPSADYMARMSAAIENAKLSAGKTPLIDKLKAEFFARNKRYPTDEELDIIIAEFNPARHQYGEVGAAIVGERPSTARGMADWRNRARTEGIEERYLERPPSEYPQYLQHELDISKGITPAKKDGGQMKSTRDMEAELAVSDRAPKRLRGYEQTAKNIKDFMMGMRNAPIDTARGYMEMGQKLGMYQPTRADETYMSAPQGRFVPTSETQSGAYQTGATLANLIGDPINYFFALPYGRATKSALQAARSRPLAVGAGMAAAPAAAGNAPGGYRSVMEDYK